MNEFNKNYDPEKLKKMLEGANYISPITIHVGDISYDYVKQNDNTVMSMVTQTLGYEVNKTDLTKALNYDRYQYIRGFEDGVDSVRRELTVYSKALDLACEQLTKCEGSHSYPYIDTRNTILYYLDKARKESET